jgi:hypothetical protein
MLRKHRGIALLLAFSAFAVLPSRANAVGSGVTLAWDANADPNVGGYKLYYGTVSGKYDLSIDVGNTTIYTVSGLGAGVALLLAPQSGEETRRRIGDAARKLGDNAMTG